MAVDLLVFGPHPDDIEIGLGATIARHTPTPATPSGLCDLTRGELSSNGTPEQRGVEADAAARCSAPRGARTWAGRTAASRDARADSIGR